MSAIIGSAVSYVKPGQQLSQVLSNAKYNIDVNKITASQIVVKALATPINPSDVVQVLGVYPSPPKFQQLGQDAHSDKLAVGGNEGLFEVIAVGADVPSEKFAVGDWVIPKIPSFGTWRTHAIVDYSEDPFIRVAGANESQKLTLESAATISINPSTALQLLEQFIHDWSPEGNDWVIANAGNSQVNKYLVQIAKHRNIKSILVIRSGKSDEDAIVKELETLGATKVITDATLLSEKFASETLPHIVGENGRVRLALNSVGGETVAKLVDALSADGYLVTYGASGGNSTIEYSLGAQLFKNITTKAYWLTKNTKANPQSKVDTVNTLIDYFKKGYIKAPEFNKLNFKPDSDTDLTQLVLKAIEDTKHGKQVVYYN